MQIPKKVYISNMNMLSFEVELPSGKVLNFQKGEKPYITSDKEELKFLSKQRGLAITDLEFKKLKRYFQDLNIPTIDNANIDLSNADKYKWSTKLEKDVMKALKERGYVVYRRQDMPEEEELVDKLEKAGFVVNKQKETKKENKGDK